MRTIRDLFVEAQKVSDYFFDLVIHQVKVWHSLWIVETAMCGCQEMCSDSASKAFCRTIDSNEGAGGVKIGLLG